MKINHRLSCNWTQLRAHFLARDAIISSALSSLKFWVCGYQFPTPTLFVFWKTEIFRGKHIGDALRDALHRISKGMQKGYFRDALRFL